MEEIDHDPRNLYDPRQREDSMRFAALEWSHQMDHGNASTVDVIARAEIYLKFLKGNG